MSQPSQVKSDDSVRQQLYRWFDSLGYHEFADGTFGEIRHSDSEGKHEYRYSEYGFLESRKGKSLTVLLLDLRHEEYPDGKVSGRFGDQCEFRALDVPAWLDHQATLQKNPSPYFDGDLESEYPYRGSLHGKGLNFIMARFADLRERPRLADWFFGRSEVVMDYGERKDLSYTQHVQDDITSGLVTQAKEQFDDLSTPRSKLLEAFNDIVARFPECPSRTDAKSYAAILTKMVAEESARKPLTNAEVTHLNSTEQAREWIWQLRDQNGHQMMEPGYTDIFASNGAWGESPADKLLKLGIAAVPSLIEALDNKELTRTVAGGWRRMDHRVLRICDAAVQILTKIANRSFTENPEGMSKGGDAEANLRRRLNAWWSDVQTRGEEAVLVAAVASGNWEKSGGVYRLVEIYPRSALAAIKLGVALAKDSYTRDMLVGSLGPLDTPAVRQFVRDQLANSPDGDTRFSAAKIVYKFDPRTATEAMIREFTIPPTNGLGRWGNSELVSFLTMTETTAALNALTRNFRKQSVSDRIEVIDSLGGFLPEKGRSAASIRESRKFARMAESVLANELTDREEEVGMLMNVGDLSFDDPRACDLAAYELSSAWPHKYHFTNFPSERARDRQCLRSLNAWRKGQGLPAMPNPPVPHVPELDARALRPLFDRLAAGKATPGEVARKGLGGLPALMRFERGLMGDRAARVRTARENLSNVVRVVKIERDSPRGKDLENYIRSLKGKPLTVEALVGVVDRMVKTRIGPTTGCRVVAKREDVTGFVLTLDLGFPMTPQGPTQTDYSARAGIVGQRGYAVSGGGSPGYIVDGSMTGGFKKALAAAPDAPVLIAVSVHRGD